MIRKLRPRRTALIFALFGAAWIPVFHLLVGVHLPTRSLAAAGVLAGIVFVGSGTLLIYALIRRTALRVEHEGAWHLNLFERNPHPMAIHDPETHRFLAVNEALLERYGYTRAEFLSMTLADIRPPEDVDAVAKAQVAEPPSDGIQRRGIWRHRLKNGTIIQVDITAHPILFEGRRAILATAEDVTARRESEEAVRAVIDCSPMALISSDMEGRIRGWNPSAEHLFGWKAAEVLGHRFPGVSEEERVILAPLRGRILAGETVWGIEQRRTRKDGSPVDVRLSAAPLRGVRGEVIGILSLLEDVGARLKAEHSLRESEGRFREMADNVRDVFYNFDAESGRILYVNPAYEALWGRTTASLYADGMSYLEGVHPEDRAKAGDAHARQLRGETTETEYRVVRPDGSLSWVFDRAVPVFREDRVERIVGTVRDVTENRRMLDALQEGERRLAAILHNLPGMAYRCRLDRDWTMLFVSEGSEALTGYMPADLVGNAVVAFGDLVHPEDQERIYNEVMEAVREDRTFELEYRLRTRSGEEKRVWERGRFLPDGGEGRLKGFIMDVTARKQAEAERERLLAAIEQMAEMMLITDARGAIQYVNPAFERVTGFSRQEVLGRNPRILKSGVQKAAFYDDMWRTLTSGKTWRGRMVNKRRDGTRFTEDALISPVFDAGGNIVNYVGVKNDVSAQLTLEEQFRQAQKMEAVGRLAGGIAHDYNNMLTVILVRAELARDRLAPDDPLRVPLGEIHEAAERSASLTRQLLTYARRQAVEPRIIVLNEAVGSTSQMLQRLMGENIELAWIPAENLWPVKVDPVQIDQLLTNLCVNARDAIADVGKVTIETANVTLDEEYCRKRPGHVPGDFVRLAVSDNGAGMDKETQAHLFEPFFTTKEVGKGTGLGLATVYGIVKQNEGFIDVYSERGDGTTFKIYLPRHAEQSTASVQKPEMSVPPAHGETVLLVEDEPLILGVTEEILKSLGYTVLSAARPSVALEIAAAHSGRIDLILTDVVMPGMNGRELVERLLQDRSDLKALFMSGYTANVIMHRGLGGDSDHFIQKPFKPRQLAAKIREVMGVKMG
jgi:PAS domain S-box-containing protein